jgi:hypothetical protein
MKNDISNRDIELLSAYLDHELSPKEQARVEERLQTNPHFRSILGELHQNRAALRSLPRLRAPRNFTLSPEIAGIKPKKHVYPVFGLVSALSSLLLILVLAGDFLVNPALITSRPPAEQPDMLAATAEIAEAMDTYMEKELEDIPSSLAAEEPVGAAEAEPAAETDIMQLRVEGATGEPVEETPIGIEIFSSKIPQGTPTPSPEGFPSIVTATPTTGQPTATLTTASPTATVESRIEELIESVVLSTPTTTVSQPSAPDIPFVRILEISLAAITLISGLVALYLRTKST